MTRSFSSLVLLGLMGLLGLLWSTTFSVVTADEHSPAEIEFFEREVRPVLAEHCYSCHSADAKKLQAGLRVDSRAALLAGGDSGASLVPGEVEASLLIEAVRYEAYEMPPSGKLPDQQIAALEKWVEMGAPWPAEATPGAADGLPPTFDLASRKESHWVWQPLAKPAVPQVADSSWPRTEIDQFILAGLAKAKLVPAADAKKSALVRRLYFDLIGLPPTPEQVSEYLAEDSSDATEKLVDQLLASPHFGERWGRHWLDLVRYAESRGHEFDNDASNAYQYRDYIIRALNADVPYDQLVREHLAGDLIAEPRLNPEHQFNESILGTGFWFLGEWVHSPVDIRKDEADRFDNMIDVMSKTFLGVTVSCARCHDHKFDAISTADYYSLSGFLQSSDYRQVRFEAIENNRQIAKQLASLDEKYQAEIQELIRKHGQPLSREAAPAQPEIEAEQTSPPSLETVDYSKLASHDFIQDGFIFGSRPKQTGEGYWTLLDGKPTLKFAKSTAAISDPIWNGMESVFETGVKNISAIHGLPRSGRTLRTPTFELTSGDVICHVEGAGHVVAVVDSHRLIAGPLHGETIRPIKSDQPFVSLNLKRYIGHRIHLEFIPAKDTQLTVFKVMQGLNSESLNKLKADDKVMTEAITRFDESAQAVLSEHASELVKTWAAEREALREKIQLRSRLAMAMLDGSGEDDQILIRGNSSKPGKLEPRHFLTAVSGDQAMKIESGSGRLELANVINDPANPLTARVAVNRIWHHLMGRGIVPTTDDFGVLGQRPTHPELLDYLANRFLNDGRSIKKTIRLVVLSRVYQMSSVPDPAALQNDPKNELWHYRPPQRLEGEVIRDALLAISGRLDATMYGEPIPIHLTAFMEGRGRPGKNGQLDGAGRRSIYIAVRRNFLSPFMLTFDTPSPFSTMGRRNVSNVPAQALILMNDPLVVEQAKLWADRATKNSADAVSRIEWLYQTAFARRPTEQELEVAIEFLGVNNVNLNQGSQAAGDVQRWADFAHALINIKEFIFVP